MSRFAACAALVTLVMVSRSAAAQAIRMDARLEARLDVRARADVAQLLDSARLSGVPIEPLVQKALEGASKHADALRITQAVRRLASELLQARLVLGPSAPDADLIAAASALRAGASADVIRKLRRERTASIAVPLALVADLVGRGVSVDQATATVLALSSHGAADAVMVAFGRQVERDISVGAPPSTAVTLRLSDAGDRNTAAAAPSTSTGELGNSKPPVPRKP